MSVKEAQEIIIIYYIQYYIMYYEYGVYNK